MDQRGSSTDLVVAAFLAHAIIAAAKLAAAGASGASAMMADAIHSVTIAAHQILLLAGLRAARGRGEGAGPGPEIYFWTHIAGVLLFSLAAGVALYAGITRLQQPSSLAEPMVAFATLGLAAVLTLGPAYAAVRSVRSGLGSPSAGSVPLRPDPVPRLVALESAVALAGVALTLAGVVGATVLGHPEADGFAAIAIGLLLGAIAARLALGAKPLLAVGTTPAGMISGIRSAFGSEMGNDRPITSVEDLTTVRLGPKDILVAARVAFRSGTTTAAAGTAVARLETRLRAEMPEIRRVLLDMAPAAATPAASSRAAAVQEPAAGPARGLAAVAAAETRPPATPAAPGPSRGAAEVPRRSYPPAKQGKRKKRR